MPMITGRTPELYWEERGAGTPIVLVMGHRFTGRMWAPILDGLAEHHRVLWFDNRGTGRSGSTRDATIADLAGDAFAVMDAAGVESAHVFGASQGGVVVLDMAMSSPERVRSLVVGCSGALTADKPRSPKWLNHLLVRIPKPLAIRLSRGGYGPACPPERVRANQELLRGETIDPRGVLAQSRALAAYTVTLEQLAAIQTPTLILHGTADKTVRFEWGAELDETLPNSRLVAYEGNGHNFVAEDPGRVISDVNAFWGDVEARHAPERA